MSDDGTKEIAKKRRVLLIGVISLAALLLFALYEGDYFMAAGFGIALLLCIYALIKVNRLKSGKMEDYVPGKGFKYYRSTPEMKLRRLNRLQIFIIALIPVTFLLDASYYIISLAIGSLVAIQYLLKPRIKFHTKIDDASLFELEELGLTGSNEVVSALYKDFQSWENVQEGNKLLVLTPDSLILFIMEDAESAVRTQCRLRDIKKLGIVEHGQYGEGLIISIVTADNKIFRIKLEGKSAQDSPEEFFKHLLLGLDEALTRTPAQPPTPSEVERAPLMENMDQSATPKIKIRNLDLENPAMSGMEETNQTQSGRVIDL